MQKQKLSVNQLLLQEIEEQNNIIESLKQDLLTIQSKLIYMIERLDKKDEV